MRRGHVRGEGGETVPGRAGEGRAGGDLCADGAVQAVAAAVDQHPRAGGLVELVHRDGLGGVRPRGHLPSQRQQPERCNE